MRRLLPRDLRYIRFAWGKPAVDSEVLELYALKSNREDLAPLSGGVVVDATQTYDMIGNPAGIHANEFTRSTYLEAMTGKAFREGTNIAIVLDEVVYSAPGVTSGAISGGRSEITGNFSLNEAIDLANVLRAGKLPAAAEIIQSEIVGPSLGKEAIHSGVYSFIIALILGTGVDGVYYGTAGILLILPWYSISCSFLVFCRIGSGFDTSWNCGYSADHWYLSRC